MNRKLYERLEKVKTVVIKDNELYKKIDALNKLGHPIDGYFPRGSANVFSEFRDFLSRFMRKWNIGQYLTRSKWGVNNKNRIISGLYSLLAPKKEEEIDAVAPPSTLNVYDDLKKTVPDSKDYSNYDFERVARTETARVKAVYQLKNFQELGVQYVVHKTKNDNRVSAQCKALNNREFAIDELLRDESKRIPVHINCIANAFSLITIKDKGMIPIKDVVVGDEVLTAKGRYKKVLETHKNYIKEDYIVINVCYDGVTEELQLTKDHPVLTDKGWVSAKDLTYNHKVVVHESIKQWERQNIDGTKDIIKEKISLWNKKRYLVNPELKKKITKNANIKTMTFTYAVIKKIDTVKFKNKRKKAVYNLSVGEDESYVVNSIVVHNCRCRYIASMKGLKK